MKQQTMKLETRFNTGDNVWVMYDNAPLCCEIIELTVHRIGATVVRDDGYHITKCPYTDITYTLKIPTAATDGVCISDTVAGSRVHASKDELLDSLR